MPKSKHTRAVAFVVMTLYMMGPMSTRELYERVCERYPKTGPSMNQLANALRFSKEIEIAWDRFSAHHPYRNRHGYGSGIGQLPTIWRHKDA